MRSVAAARGDEQHRRPSIVHTQRYAVARGGQRKRVRRADRQDGEAVDGRELFEVRRYARQDATGLALQDAAAKRRHNPRSRKVWRSIKGAATPSGAGDTIASG